MNDPDPQDWWHDEPVGPIARENFAAVLIWFALALLAAPFVAAFRQWRKN